MGKSFKSLLHTFANVFGKCPTYYCLEPKFCSGTGYASCAIEIRLRKTNYRCYTWSHVMLLTDMVSDGF